MWYAFGGFLFLTYVIGYFVVGVLLLGIGSNFMKIFNIIPKEYFNLNEHGDFWNKYYLVGYGLWYLFSLIVVCKWGKS